MNTEKLIEIFDLCIAHYSKPDSWCQDGAGGAGRAGDKVCANVGLYDIPRMRSKALTEHFYDAQTVLLKAITSETLPGGGSAGRKIINWNDAPERTQADVLAAFVKARASLEAT